MHRVHHHMKHRIDNLLRLFGIAVFDQLHRVPDVGKENGDLLPFSFKGLPRGQYFFSEMSGNITVWRGYPGNSGGCDGCRLIYGLAANSAKRGSTTVRFTTVRTDRFKPRPAVFTKDGIRQIVALTLRANHDGNQSQLGRIVPNSFKPGLSAQGREQAVYSTRLYQKQVRLLQPVRLADTCPSMMRIVSSTRPERLPPKRARTASTLLDRVQLPREVRRGPLQAPWPEHGSVRAPDDNVLAKDASGDLEPRLEPPCSWPQLGSNGPDDRQLKDLLIGSATRPRFLCICSCWTLQEAGEQGPRLRYANPLAYRFLPPKPYP